MKTDAGQWLKGIILACLFAGAFPGSLRADEELQLVTKEVFSGEGLAQGYHALELWSNATKSRVVSMVTMKPAGDEHAVRAQLAGIADPLSKPTHLLVPDEISFTTFAGFPAQVIRGESHMAGIRRKHSITIIFTQANSHVIDCFCAPDEELPAWEKYISLEGAPSPFADEAFSKTRPRLQEFTAKLHQVILELVALSEKSAEAAKPRDDNARN